MNQKFRIKGESLYFAKISKGQIHYPELDSENRWEVPDHIVMDQDILYVKGREILFSNQEDQRQSHRD